jgi:predicted AlkP superfamily phosphohydrolase/phosphomutase
MGPHTGASYHLAAWLEAQGFMKRKPAASPRASLLNAGRRAAKNLLPVAIKEKIKAGVGAERIKRMQAAEKDSFYASIDWANTVAYTEPGRHVININLAGRNAAGTVASADYEKVCAQISAALGRWQDPRGIPAVERVAHRDEVYSGPYVERASDLYVYWNPAAQFGDPPRGVQARGFWWSGDHRPEGILIGKGPGIATGARLKTATVYDLLPTMMYGAGLAVPAALDGQVMQAAFTESFLALNPMRESATAEHRAADRSHLSGDEEALIEEKLRSLGYL